MTRLELFEWYSKYLLECGLEDVYLVVITCTNTSDLREADKLYEWMNDDIVQYDLKYSSDDISMSASQGDLIYTFIVCGSKNITILGLKFSFSQPISVISLKEVSDYQKSWKERCGSERSKYEKMISTGCFHHSLMVHDFMNRIGFKKPNQFKRFVYNFTRRYRNDPVDVFMFYSTNTSIGIMALYTGYLAISEIIAVYF